jgi:hypothetical protein
MKASIKKYTVIVTKCDRAVSRYFVAATSAGGAEETTLREVYQAQYATAVEGWPIGQTYPDLISRGAAIVATQSIIDAM